MAYSGRYSVKNPEKYQGDHTNVVYRSLWEKYAFLWCDDNSNIIEWSSEETVIPYLYEVDKRYHRYFVDLKIKTKDGKTWLIEIKPDKETRVPTGQRKTRRYVEEAMTFVKNQNKWNAAEEYAKDRGWHFAVWTEKTEPLKSIMPKINQTTQTVSKT